MTFVGDTVKRRREKKPRKGEKKEIVPRCVCSTAIPCAGASRTRECGEAKNVGGEEAKREEERFM